MCVYGLHQSSNASHKMFKLIRVKVNDVERERERERATLRTRSNDDGREKENENGQFQLVDRVRLTVQVTHSDR